MAFSRSAVAFKGVRGRATKAHDKGKSGQRHFGVKAILLRQPRYHVPDEMGVLTALNRHGHGNSFYSRCG